MDLPEGALKEKYFKGQLDPSRKASLPKWRLAGCVLDMLPDRELRSGLWAFLGLRFIGLLRFRV